MNDNQNQVCSVNAKFSKTFDITTFPDRNMPRLLTDFMSLCHKFVYDQNFSLSLAEKSCHDFNIAAVYKMRNGENRNAKGDDDQVMVRCRWWCGFSRASLWFYSCRISLSDKINIGMPVYNASLFSFLIFVWFSFVCFFYLHFSSICNNINFTNYSFLYIHIDQV